MGARGETVVKPSAVETTQSILPAPTPAPPSGRKKLAAADFYSALQRSLDTVQRQLSSANNTFADFVVKEFKIDAAVQVNTNELGVLQLVLADDNMSPHSVSRLSLTLAAVAKIPDQAAPPQNMVKADVTALSDLDWLPPQLIAELAKYEVKTAAEFLGLVSDARFTTQIVSLLKLQRADLGRWANQMRLLELPGITLPAVRALTELGISAVADLANLSDKALAEFERKAPETLPRETLVSWREAAKSRAGGEVRKVS
jgi:hypothetical protein